MTSFKENVIKQAQDYADSHDFDRFEAWFQAYNHKLISLIANECIESINHVIDNDKSLNCSELMGCEYAISAIEEKFPVDN